MENYSFLVLCSPGERSTGEWPQVWWWHRHSWDWELLPRLDQLWARTGLSQAQLRAWNELRLLCWGWVAQLGAEGAAPAPLGRAGAAAALLGDLFQSVCPSEPEEAMDAGLACHPWFPGLSTDQWPHTLCDTVSMSLVSKKSPTKLKKHHVVNRHLSCGTVCWLRLHHSHSLVNNSHCEFLGLAALRSAVWCFSRRSSVNWAPSSSLEPTLLKVCACEFSLSY